MLGGSAVAIDPGSTTTRVVMLRGSPGRLQVVRAESFVIGASNTSLASVVADVKSKKIPAGRLILGASGQTATLRYNLLPPVPDWRLELILKYETEEMVEKSGEPLSSAFLQLDLPESESDDRVLLVGLGKDQLIGPQIDEVESAGGRVHSVLPQAMGLYHAYRQGFAKPPSGTVLLTDIGAQETHIVLVTDGRLVFARSVNFGGEQVDEAIAAALGIRSDQAAKLKHKLSSGKVPSELAPAASGAVRSAMGQLVRVLQSSISFCRLQTKIPSIDLDQVLVSGGTARLEGLTTILGEHLKAPVELFQPEVEGELPGPAGEWAVAIGLAASAFDPDQATLDLLPAEAKEKREYRDRTLFLHASGGVLALALVVFFVVAFMNNRGASERFASLEGQQRVVQGLLKKRKDAEEKNQAYRRQIDRLKKELSTTTFQSQILDILRNRLPSAVAIESVALERLEDEGVVTVALDIQGRSDNSERRGIEHVRSFQQTLDGLPGVVRADVELGVLEDDGTYPFTVKVSPDPEPEDKNKPKRRRGR